MHACEHCVSVHVHQNNIIVVRCLLGGEIELDFVWRAPTDQLG